MSDVIASSQSKARVAIIGAGFSGLTLAWALSKIGIRTEVFEKTDRTGGLLQTVSQPLFGESAANALLASKPVEELFSDVGLKPIVAGFKSNNRYIFRGKPSRWPLKFSETVPVIWNFFKNYILKTHKPQKHESLQAWVLRTFKSEVMVRYVFTPAFQGIYATPANRLSAELVTASLFNHFLRSARGRLKGSVSALTGMGGLMQALTEHLFKKDVLIHRGTKLDLAELQKKFSAVVIATPLHTAAQILQQVSPEQSQKMMALHTQPVTSVNVVFKKPRTLRGFGCLFPPTEKFNAMGVLFNTDIFEGRGEHENETWIFAGAAHKQADLADKIRSDRQRMAGESDVPAEIRVNQWPQGLPIYDDQLRHWLEQYDKNTQSPSALKAVHEGFAVQTGASPIYLTGNYLGAIGLTKILDYNLRLAERIRRELP